MKTKHLARVLAAAAMIGLTGCPETTAPHNFGTKPLNLKTEEWNGVWRNPIETDGMTFTVTDAAKGQLTITFPEKDGKKEEPMKVVINEVGGGEKNKDLAFFVHFDKANETTGPFNLIRRTDKGVFYFWNPKHDVIEAAVKNGELKGELIKMPKTKDEAEHNHTRLAADPANYEKLLDPKFWEWTDVSVFVRQARL